MPEKKIRRNIRLSGEVLDSHTELQRMLDASEISLILDTYDDIFSDFDARPYDHRSLSQDFLLEAKRAARDKISGLELKFLIPKAQKDERKEELIELRLREHFEKHAYLVRQDVVKSRYRGALMILIGMTITIIAASIGFFFEKSFALEVGVVVMEPAGWFTIWNGLDMMVFAVKGKEADIGFYEKMQDAEITFEGY